MRKRKPKTVMMRVTIPTRNYFKELAKQSGKSLPDAMKDFARRMRTK